MISVPPALSFLLLIVAGWVHRQQLIVIEFLQTENRLLKDPLCGKRSRSPMQGERCSHGKQRQWGARLDRHSLRPASDVHSVLGHGTLGMGILQTRALMKDKTVAILE